MEGRAMLLWTSAGGAKETGVENPRIWKICVGVEIPRMKAGTGVSRELLSRVSEFPHRGEMSSADDSDGKAERLPQPRRAGMAVGV